MEPKTVQELFDMSKEVSSEEKYYSAIRLLDQWNDKYLKTKSNDEGSYDEWKSQKINVAKVQLDLEKQELCFKRLEEIMDDVYSDLKTKHMSLYKKILENLKEIAKKYLYVSNGQDKEENIIQFNFHVGELYKNIIEIDGLELVKDTENKLKENFVRFYYTVNTQLYDPPTEEVLAKESNLTKEEEIQKRKYAYGHWENGKCKHTPCIIYRLKDGCKYRPEHDDCTSGINLRLQETVSLEPNKLRKIDLGVKMFSNRCRPVQLTPKLDTCLKYSVHLMTGLVDVWFNHYTQIGIHNLSNEKVTIPEGTSMCEVHCLEHPVKLIDEYESKTIDHGGELDPNSLYIDRLWKFAEGDKKIFDRLKEKLDKYPIEGPIELEEIHCNTVRIIEEISELNPDKIFLDFMHINIMGSEEEKIEQINELLEYEDKFLVNKSLYISSILPVVHNNELELVLGKEDPRVDPENFRDSDGKIPELSDKERDALLAADLSDNFKLSVTTMVELQNKEKRIREI
jgi:hypothetical protein